MIQSYYSSRHAARQAPSSSLLGRERHLRLVQDMTSVNVHVVYVNEHGVAPGGAANVAATFGGAIFIGVTLTFGIPGLKVPGCHHPGMAARILASDIASHRYAAVLVWMSIAHGCLNCVLGHSSTLL